MQYGVSANRYIASGITLPTHCVDESRGVPSDRVERGEDLRSLLPVSVSVRIANFWDRQSMIAIECFCESVSRRIADLWDNFADTSPQRRGKSWNAVGADKLDEERVVGRSVREIAVSLRVSV